MNSVFAVIDLGSNSVNMAVYDVSGRRLERLKKSREMLGILGYIQTKRAKAAVIRIWWQS